MYGERGYQIDPHSGNRVALGTDSARTADHGKTRMTFYRLHIPNKTAANETAAV
jgi:hypothetical protein